MFEFHGWFTIRKTTGDDDKGLSQAVERLSTLIESLNGRMSDGTRDSNALIKLQYMNGEAFLHLAGNKNHRSTYWKDIQMLLEWICREAPGSFGLLYWRDDEGDLPAGGNNFSVIVMRRGQLTTHLDPFLSPIIPLVEDDGP